MMYCSETYGDLVWDTEQGNQILYHIYTVSDLRHPHHVCNGSILGTFYVSYKET